MKVKTFSGGAKGGGGNNLKGKNTFKKFNKDGKKDNGVVRPGQNRFHDDQQDGFVPHFQKEEKLAKHKVFDDDGRELVSKANNKNKFTNGANGKKNKIDGEKKDPKQSKHTKFESGGKKERTEQDENSPVNGNEQKKMKKNKKKEGKGVTREVPAVKHREGQKWYQYQINEQIKESSDRLEAEKAKPIEEEADLLLRTDMDLYSRLMRSQSGGEAAWLQTIMAKGTAGDRKTAMTLQTKSSPVHSISFIRSMVHTVERQNVRESMELIPLLTEVFIDELLPSDRKLVSFGSRPLARINEICAHSVQTRKRLLVLWRFEHELKMVYERFTKALESLASGAIEKLCIACVEAGQNLLVQRMEQENFLLQLLVNKLGHPNSKVAHRCENLLGDLSRKQMNMRPNIVTEVERLIYRRNVSERAQQHAASFLSQLVLRAGEDTLAVQLLTIYFGLFKTLVAAKKTDGKLVGILLAGANRAFPYAKGKMDSLVDEMESLYRLVHQAPFGVALQTLKLLHHVLGINDSLSDRFYATLYRKLLDHAPSTAQHQLLDLLWKTLKTDQVTSRVRAFVKRLLQIASSESAGFAAGILILVSRLIESRPQLIVRERDAQNELLVESVGVKGIEVEDDEEERYVDLDDDGKPLERGIKGEKREEGEDEDSDDEVEEVSLPVKTEKGGKKKEKEDDNKKIVKGSLQPLPTKGWVHRKNQVHHGGVSLYSSSARNPLFISSHGTFDAELVLLTQHFHPSIVVFAQTLIQGKTINYGADPLEDFTTISFLDRFVYRNPKTTVVPKGVLGVQKKGAVGVKALAISSKEYLSKSLHEIPADERFLYRFATLNFAAKGDKRSKGDEYDDDAASINSDEFERVMERFEPGEANDDFDIDFGKEFSSEKQKKKSAKRKISDMDGEEDEDEDEDGENDADGWSDEDLNDLDEEEDEDDDGDGEDDEDEDEEMEEDEDEDDEDIEIEGEESDDDYGIVNSKKGKRMDSDESDEDYGENDAFVSADRFAEEMEGFGDEETREQRKERLKKKVKRVKGRKYRMGDKSDPPETLSATHNLENIKSAVQWYDSPSSTLQRRVKSDIPKNTEMEDDPFFGKAMESENETSNSCDGFNTRLPHSSRKFRRRLRPSASIEGLNGKEEGKKEGGITDQTDNEVNSSPASSTSTQLNGDDLIEQGRRSVQLLKSRCQTIGNSEEYDITTPKRKRKLEDEGIEGPEDECDENKAKKSDVTLLTPSLSRPSDNKRGRMDGTGISTSTPVSSSISGVSDISIHSNSVTPRRISGGRSSKRDELIDTPDGSQKEEEKKRKDAIENEKKKAIRREKYGNQPNFDSDDSFYDSD